MVKQISIFVENRSGALAKITDLIAKNDINILALSIADTTSFGILRLIVDEPDKLEAVLAKNKVTASSTNVFAVKFKNQPGAAHSVISMLAEADIGVEYMYGTITLRDNQSGLVFRVDKEDEAQKLLAQNGYCIADKSID